MTRESWAKFWGSETAQHMRPEHDDIVIRLFERKDERTRAYRTVCKVGRTVRGSQGQPVQHPLLKYIKECDEEIRALEASLGATPVASARLLQAGTRTSGSLDDENAVVNAAMARDDADDDPRVQAIH